MNLGKKQEKEDHENLSDCGPQSIPKLKVVYVGLIKSAAGKSSDTIYLEEKDGTANRIDSVIHEGAITMNWGLTVIDLLRKLVTIYGESFAAQILTVDDSLRNGVYVLVDGTNIDYLDGVLTKLQPSSESQIVLAPASTGG